MTLKFKENRVWRAYNGGMNLDRFVGKEDPANGRFPEEWIASTVVAVNSDREGKIEGVSICEDGKNFKELLEQYPEEMLGRKQCEKYNSRMSILVKLLDAQERLSIQCHPTASFAMENLNSNFGKAECWYILESEKDAHVYLGFKKGITREKWIEMFEKQDIEGMLHALHKHPAKKGDIFFVDGGVPHAIGSGCFMIELQEPSDLMVIPERITHSGIKLSDGKLHGGLGFDRMFECFHYNGMTLKEVRQKYYRHPPKKKNRLSELLGKEMTDKFEMKLLYIDCKMSTDFNKKYAVAIVTDGSGYVSTGDTAMQISKGDKFFIPASVKEVSWDTDNKEELTVVLCFPGE